jgi:hypothetical protein
LDSLQRFVTATSLVVFTGVIVVGALAVLVLPVARPPVATAERSGSPATSCRGLFDRDCLSRRELPAGAPPRPSNADAAEPTPDADSAPGRPSTADRNVAGLPVPPAQPTDFAAPLPAAPMEPERQVAQPDGRKPAVAPPPAAQPSEAPRSETPLAPSATAERQVAKPTVGAPARPPAPKKIARPERRAKPPANEALNAVRRFGGSLTDIPVSAYSADGTQRTIVIRPTSIQDVYYYSTPR